MFNATDIPALIAMLPATFQLRAHKGTFTINESASYVSAGRAMLYVFNSDGEAFCKGTYAELKREII